ncbi:CREG1-like protein [Drosera capensis]
MLNEDGGRGGGGGGHRDANLCTRDDYDDTDGYGGGYRGGAPFGNVVSFSDGFPGNGSGIPYFYLTTLDPTAEYALKDQRSSLTVSEYALGTCGKKDPENPSCAKMTLTGKLKLVMESSNEGEFARSALFSKHPEMKDWPEEHNFRFFKLDIEDIFLINWFGGQKPLTVDQYLNFEMERLGIM